MTPGFKSFTITELLTLKYEETSPLPSYSLKKQTLHLSLNPFIVRLGLRFKEKEDKNQLIIDSVDRDLQRAILKRTCVEL